MEQAINDLKTHISGGVVLPEDDAYDTLRQVPFNHSAKPLAIVECKTVGDVTAAINFARVNHIKLSIRSGGHSGAGLSTNDNGLVVDLSPLKQVEVINAEKGIVRLGAGAKWGDVAKALQSYNLAISSGDTNDVGVGGLTLSGGIGWMVRTVGLSIDNLEAVELISANGKQLRASVTENTDLFWAVRGGGGNFGVATAFEFRAVPCDGIVGGKLLFDAADREAVLVKWSAYMRMAPERLSSTVLLFPGFGPEAKPQVIVMVCYADNDEVAAQEAIQPLRELAPLMHEDIKPMPYADMLEDARDISAMKMRIRNGFVREITPELIKALAENFGKPGTSPLQIRSLSGAMSRVPSDAMAFEHRDVEALIVMNAILPQTVSDEQADQNADTLWVPLKPFVRGAYAGFQTDSTEMTVDEAYETNRERLSRIKAIYDPQNLFDQNANVKPAL